MERDSERAHGRRESRVPARVDRATTASSAVSRTADGRTMVIPCKRYAPAFRRGKARGPGSPPMLVCLVQPPGRPSSGFGFAVPTAQQVPPVQHEPEMACRVGTFFDSSVE